MAKIGSGKQNLTRYQALIQQQQRRRAIIEQGVARSENMRSYMVANINKNASAAVQTSEMQLRAKAQAAAKSRADMMLNKLA
jgi:hypothetical protein